MQGPANPCVPPSSPSSGFVVSSITALAKKAVEQVAQLNVTLSANNERLRGAYNDWHVSLYGMLRSLGCVINDDEPADVCDDIAAMHEQSIKLIDRVRTEFSLKKTALEENEKRLAHERSRLWLCERDAEQRLEEVEVQRRALLGQRDAAHDTLLALTEQLQTVQREQHALKIARLDAEMQTTALARERDDLARVRRAMDVDALARTAAHAKELSQAAEALQSSQGSVQAASTALTAAQQHASAAQQAMAAAEEQSAALAERQAVVAAWEEGTVRARAQLEADTTRTREQLAQQREAVLRQQRDVNLAKAALDGREEDIAQRDERNAHDARRLALDRELADKQQAARVQALRVREERLEADTRALRERVGAEERESARLCAELARRRMRPMHDPDESGFDVSGDHVVIHGALCGPPPVDASTPVDGSPHGSPLRAGPSAHTPRAGPSAHSPRDPPSTASHRAAQQ